MKRLLITALLWSVGTAAVADGLYKPIPYYGGDPFTFCKLGVPEDCWEPVDPTQGTYRVTHKRCFKKESAQLYQEVCKAPFAPGTGGDKPVVPPDWVNGRPQSPPTNTYDPDPSLKPTQQPGQASPTPGTTQPATDQTPPFAAPPPDNSQGQT